MGCPLVSIVVPVLHDAEALSVLLTVLPAGPEVEVIVVDGASDDPAMAALRTGFPAVTWEASPRGRARQMNHGAGRATGRWLIFLHADGRLTEGWFDVIAKADRDPATIGGSFRFALNSPAPEARVVEWGVRQRLRWFGLPYGDQALFVRREVFTRLGGYHDLPLMEDVDFVRRLRYAGRLHHSDLPILVSPRRWHRDGWWWRSIQNVMLVFLFQLGASPQWLARRYYGTTAAREIDRARRNGETGNATAGLEAGPVDSTDVDSIEGVRPRGRERLL